MNKDFIGKIHSQGPWDVRPAEGKSGTKGFYVYGHDVDICNVYRNSFNEAGEQTGIVPFENDECNAYLIAAAPTMHRALSATQIFHNDAPWDEEKIDMFEGTIGSEIPLNDGGEDFLEVVEEILEDFVMEALGKAEKPQ